MRLSLIISLLGICLHLHSQDTAYVMRMIDSLCKPSYHGRGYVESGDVKASNFLANELKSIGAEPVMGSYFQPFELEVNTFPGALNLSIDGKELKTGVEYIIDPVSGSAKGEFQLIWLEPKYLKKPKKLLKEIEDGSEVIIVIDETDESLTTKEEFNALIQSLTKNPFDVAGYFRLTDKKLTWHVSREAANHFIFTINRDAIKKSSANVKVEIDQKWIQEYPTQNVIGKIPGKRSDSILVYTAHYDHLGRMGADTYIAGASDNASGTAMLLDVAQHCKSDQPEFDTYFIFFAAEEAGLVGSFFFVDNTPIELDRIKFLMNLDLMADAKTGITAVNGKVFESQFSRLVSLNEKQNSPLEIKARKEAANSDHYPFYLKGVPCFFIYTRGDYKHYHDVNDIPENIPLTNYEAVFKLITSFMESL